MQETLINARNPRYYQDETGQWWYQPNSKGSRKWPRIRAYAKECCCCGKSFLWQARTRHSKSKDLGPVCGQSCAGRMRFKSGEIPLRGESHPCWKGGKRTRQDGYVGVWAPDHPSLEGSTARYVLEHRLVMEQALSRPLHPYEEVHHKNSIRSDNRLENLELWVKRQPGGARAKDLIDYARWILETYGPLEDKLL